MIKPRTVLLFLGIFFIIDSFFLHTISFDYEFYGLGWLDSFFSHAMLGTIIVFYALYPRIKRERII